MVKNGQDEGQSSFSQKENIAKVVSVIFGEDFLVITVMASEY